MSKFDAFCKKAWLSKGEYTPPHKLVAFDPGHTTGIATFIDGQLQQVDQLATHPMPDAIDILNQYITEDIDQIVYEDYKVYAWKSDDHKWASLFTPQLLGVIQTLAQLKDIPIYSQMAQQAKGFCSDKILKEWDYYPTSLKHGRDAIRHGCYYLLFNHGKALPINFDHSKPGSRKK